MPTPTLSLKIDGMDCAAEETLIRKALDRPEISGLQFDLVNRRLVVGLGSIDAAAILAVLASIGMRAEVIEDTAVRQRGPAEPARRLSHRAWLLLFAGGACALGAELVALLNGNETSWLTGLLSLLAIALSGVPTLRKAWYALKTFTLNINLLMAVAVVGAVLIGEWPEAAVVIWLFGIAELIETSSLDKARDAIRQLVSLAPETACVRQPDNTWIVVAATTVRLSDIVRVRPGERIALDGVVVAGDSTVNQAPITGESMPIEKQPGDPLFAGSINERGVLEFRVTAASGETTLDRMAHAVQAAEGKRAPTQRFVDRFARIYMPAVVLTALAVAVLPPLLMGGAWHEWIYKGLTLLIIACPCALVISTPVTIVTGLAAAARRGIVVKGGLYLEQGNRLRAIALDKTGTITHGKPELTDVVPLGNLAGDAALRIAASLDALSEHPVAAAIVRACKSDSLFKVVDFEARPGRGVSGVIDSCHYNLGNHRLIEELGICDAALEQQLDRLESDARTAVVLATDSQALAVFAVADTVRASSRLAVEELRALNVHVVMLTGDNDKTAKAIAAQVGIADARGDLLPEGKLDALAALKSRGLVGMVGDGVNDAPALASADIGLAMGAAGTDVAIETADVALMQDDLRKIPEFIRLSRRTAAILWQNIAIALTIKFVFFALTLAGQSTLWMAVFADVGASLIVTFNGLRLRGLST